MEDRFNYDAITYTREDAYCDGFEDASSGSNNDNPHDANKERKLYDAYEQGYAEGSEE